MADEAPSQAPEVAQATKAVVATAAPPAEETAPESVAPPADAKPAEMEPVSAAEHAKKEEVEEENKDKEADKPAEESSAAATSSPAPPPEEKPADGDEDVEMKDKPAEEATEPATETKADSEKPADASSSAAVEAGADADSAGDKSKARRKSSAVPEHVKGGKKLNKKPSKAKILHLDAKPGQHFFAKLKGFPPWPVIVCEEDMLPQNMLSTRPVTAARPDGTYREDFADGGKRVADRTFPVMYLHTNEFSWTPNTDLTDLDPTTVADLITPKMRKDLQAAHLLAAEQNDLDYYKNVLREFEEQRLANLEAKAAKSRTPKKKTAEAAVDDDGDLDMADADEGADAEGSEKKSKPKKRKADDDNSTPQRSDSVKKPKIKLTSNSTPKTANGNQSPKAGKESTSKAAKSKGKQSKAAKDADAKQAEIEAAAAQKEPELTPEERHLRKEKEILFLRHRLQKGLLIRDQEPKEEEMKPMSDFLAKLETFPDLEVSIIRATKINKVLKAILKLEAIPKEEEFKFKTRSQSLLDKWNKILAADGGAAAPTSATNGVNGTSGETSKKDKETTNGVKETSTEAKTEAPKNAEKDAEKDAEKVTAAAEQVTKEEGSDKKAPKADSETEDKPTTDEDKPATLDAPTKISSAS